MITATEIDRYVERNRDEIIECLVELLQTPSVTGEEVAVSKVFAKWIKKIGLEPQIVGISQEHPNVIAEWRGRKPGKRFIFNGHMDHFPPSADDEGMFGPYSGKIDGGYVYGRGACDMKGGDAAVLMATGMLKRMGFDLNGSIYLCYTCDEEIGGRYGIKWLLENDYLHGDYGIVPEPTDKKIMIGHSGILRMFFTYTAEPAHSGRDHPQMDALEKTIIAIKALYDYRDNVVRKRVDPDYGKASLNITTLHAGTATNVHATKSTFSIDRRIIPGETHEIAKAEIFNCLDNLKYKYKEMDYSYQVISDRPFLDIPPNLDIVVAAREAYEEITGNKAQLLKRHGGSDAATVQSFNGICLPNWGAASLNGDGSGFFSAQPNERISINDYIESVKYYMLTVVKLLGD